MADAGALKTIARVTTQYDAVQDRVSLSGELSDGTVAVAWLTRRLLERLLPELFGWIEQGDADAALPRSDLLQSFKQQSAAGRLEASGPVAAEQATAEWLVTSIDVQKRAERLRLVFRAPQLHDDRVALDLEPVPLRQWLQILLVAYQRAGWPLASWPSWMREQLTEPSPTGAALH